MADDEKTPETPAVPEATPTPKTEVQPPPAPAPKAEAGETYTKADMERITQERLKQYQEKRSKEEEKARKDAVAAALKEQGEFAKLADAKQAEADEANRKLAEIEPVVASTTAERDRYKAVLEAHLEAQRKGLPKHLVDLLDRLDVADQLEYLAKNADAVKAPAPEPRPNGSTPSRRSGTTAIGDATTQLPTPPFSLVRGF